MRNLSTLMLFVMVTSLLSLSSCSSNDDGGDGGSAGSGTLIAKVDGTAYQSMSISSSATVANNGQNLEIIASNSDGNAFAINILGGFDGVGTYSIGGGANIVNTASYTETEVNISNPQASTTEIWQAPYDDTMVGEVKISEETANTIIGTFSFKAKNVNGDQSIKTITEGAFNLEKTAI